MKKLKAFEVHTMNDSVRMIFEMAEKYKEDTKQKRMSAKELYAYCQSKYQKENGEIFRRPKFFDETGGDCDCQAIYVISVFLNWGIPKSKINLIVCGQKKFGHIFPIIDIFGKTIFFDMLPKRKYNERHFYRLTKTFNFFA